jgi:hypothetical protein
MDVIIRRGQPRHFDSTPDRLPAYFDSDNSSMSKKLLVLPFLLLSACTSNHYYRTEISDTPCQVNQTNSCISANLVENKTDNYRFGFVEIDDQGQFYDQRQVESLLKNLKTETQPQYVTIFVHGWHHNANETDYNLKRFKDILKDSKARNPNHAVTGVYIGWRGETIDLPWLKLLSFWDRKSVSEEVGRNSLLDLLLQIESIIKTPANSDNKLLTIGHSLGASVIFNALHPLLLQRLNQPADSSLRHGFGDMVVLVNPAFEAIRYVAIRDAAQRHSRQFQFSDKQKPLMIIATAESDNTTKLAFSWGRKISTVFEEHRLYSTLNTDLSEQWLSEWDLDTTAIGHFNPYITHKLQAETSSEDYQCTANPGWLETAVQRQKQSQSAKGSHSTGLGWTIQNTLQTDVIKLQLSHLQQSAANDPYWVLQTDANIFPNHGFISQKHFWCFVDLTMTQAVWK